MIDPKELRIGNIIKTIGGILKYWTIMPEDFMPISNNSQLYEPVLLTENWLIKFGFEIRYFKDDRSMPLWWKVEGNRHIDIYPKGEGFFFLINSIQMSVPIIFVHQIQNLYFALTSQELIYNETHK